MENGDRKLSGVRESGRNRRTSDSHPGRLHFRGRLSADGRNLWRWKRRAREHQQDNTPVAGKLGSDRKTRERQERVQKAASRSRHAVDGSLTHQGVFAICWKGRSGCKHLFEPGNLPVDVRWAGFMRPRQLARIRDAGRWIGETTGRHWMKCLWCTDCQVETDLSLYSGLHEFRKPCIPERT